MREVAKYLTATGRSGATPEESFFVNSTGKRVSYRNLHARVWTPVIERAGLQELRIHDLRKTAATRLLQAGVDHETVTAMLGHEDIHTAFHHYAKATPQSLLWTSEVRAVPREDRSQQDARSAR